MSSLGRTGPRCSSAAAPTDQGTLNKSLPQTGHAISALSWRSVFSRLRQLQSLVFGEGRRDTRSGRSCLAVLLSILAARYGVCHEGSRGSEAVEGGRLVSDTSAGWPPPA